MKYIDMENWNRRDHYNYFSKLSYPHFNICANVDITLFQRYIKENRYPFFISLLYASTKAANHIKEFRYRIRENKVLEHDTVSPSFTVITRGDVFSFCTAKYVEHYPEFRNNASEAIEKMKNNVTVDDEPGRDDLLYITSLPWISFTGLVHPIQMDPVDSIPRISWGKFFTEGNTVKLPFSVQVHHALADGLHAGRYFELLQDICNHPEEHLI